eukprot:GHVP01015801.1.p1 GENE.GHVP01015801.1~~GHVP01015801.1.p1  ORF type:complete len:2018 (-),score=352.60 GHVP01015801.1:637-6690(-)
MPTICQYVDVSIQEIAIEGRKGSDMTTLWQNLESRGFILDAFTKSRLWEVLLKHNSLVPVVVENTKPTDRSVTPTNTPTKMNLKTPSYTVNWRNATSRSVAEAAGGTIYTKNPDQELIVENEASIIKLVAYPIIRYGVLNVLAFDDILDNPLKTDILEIVARSRYSGVWHFELCSELNIAPKYLFYFLCSFYEHDCLVKFLFSVPRHRKKEEAAKGAVSSGIIWLKQFFDVTKFSSELTHAFTQRYIQPTEARVEDILKKATNNLLLENDLHEFVFSLFTNQETGRLVMAPRACLRFYIKLKKKLLANGNVFQVKAWCDQTATYERCLRLVTTEDPKEVTVIRSDPQLTISNFKQSFETQEEEAVPLLEDDNEEIGNADNQYINRIVTLPLRTQIVEKLKIHSVEGLLGTELAAFFGISIKKFSKALNSLLASELVLKLSERIGKKFVYRYFIACEETRKIILQHTRKGEKVKRESTVKKEQQSPSSSRNSLSCENRMITPLFLRRMEFIRAQVVNNKLPMTYPELKRRIQIEENTPYQCDRRTIQRIFDKLSADSPEISMSKIGPGFNSGCTFIYDNRIMDEESAAKIIKKVITANRSQSVKQSYELLKKMPDVACFEDVAGAVQPAKRRKTAPSPLVDDADVEVILSQNESEGEVVDVDMEAIEVKNPIHHPATKTAINPYPMPVLEKNVRVEKQEADWGTTSKFRPQTFSQKRLVHNGFVASVSVRLQIFLSYLYHCIVSGIANPYQDPSGDKNEESPFVAETSIDQMMRWMTVELYVQVVGCGYQCDFLDAYLCREVSRSIKMGELKSDVFHQIVRIHRYDDGGVVRMNSRSYYSTLRTLLSRLCALGIVDLVSSESEKHSFDDPAVIEEKNIRWRWRRKAPILKFYADREPEVTAEVDLMQPGAVTEYWRLLKEQVNAWNNKFEKGDFCLPHSFWVKELFSSRSWTATPFLTPYARRYLQKVSEQVVESTRKESVQKAGDSSMDLLPSRRPPLIISPQTPLVRKAASQIGSIPEVVIRFIQRHIQNLHVEGSTENPALPEGSIIFRRLCSCRFKCDICGTIFALRPAFEAHYKSAHDSELPKDPTLYEIVAATELFSSVDDENATSTQIEGHSQLESMIQVDSEVQKLFEFFESPTNSGSIRVSSIKRQEEVTLISILIFAIRVFYSTKTQDGAASLASKLSKTNLESLPSLSDKSDLEDEEFPAKLNLHSDLYNNSQHKVWEFVSSLLPSKGKAGISPQTAHLLYTHLLFKDKKSYKTQRWFAYLCNLKASEILRVNESRHILIKKNPEDAVFTSIGASDVQLSPTYFCSGPPELFHLQCAILRVCMLTPASLYREKFASDMYSRWSAFDIRSLWKVMESQQLVTGCRGHSNFGSPLELRVKRRYALTKNAKSRILPRFKELSFEQAALSKAQNYVTSLENLKGKDFTQGYNSGEDAAALINLFGSGRLTISVLWDDNGEHLETNFADEELFRLLNEQTFDEDDEEKSVETRKRPSFSARGRNEEPHSDSGSEVELYFPKKRKTGGSSSESEEETPRRSRRKHTQVHPTGGLHGHLKRQVGRISSIVGIETKLVKNESKPSAADAIFVASTATLRKQAAAGGARGFYRGVNQRVSAPDSFKVDTVLPFLGFGIKQHISGQDYADPRFLLPCVSRDCNSNIFKNLAIFEDEPLDYWHETLETCRKKGFVEKVDEIFEEEENVADLTWTNGNLWSLAHHTWTCCLNRGYDAKMERLTNEEEQNLTERLTATTSRIFSFIESQILSSSKEIGVLGSDIVEGILNQESNVVDLVSETIDFRLEECFQLLDVNKSSCGIQTVVVSNFFWPSHVSMSRQATTKELAADLFLVLLESLGAIYRVPCGGKWRFFLWGSNSVYVIPTRVARNIEGCTCPPNSLPGRISSVWNHGVRSDCSARSKILESLGIKSESNPGVPASTWTRLDGRLNCGLLSFICYNIYFLCSHQPGISLHQLLRILALISSEELGTLLSCLVNDGNLHVSFLEDGQILFSPRQR